MEPTQIDFLEAHIESLEAENAKLKADRDKLVELVFRSWDEVLNATSIGDNPHWENSKSKHRLDEIIGGGAEGGGT